MRQNTKACIPEITLATDMMSAKLKLHLDEFGQELTAFDIKQLLEANKVKSGIMIDAIQKMLEHEIYEVFVEVARGKAAVKGDDGYFVFHVSNPDIPTEPKILEDGSVEYVHTTEYTIVDEDDLLAEYVPATNGEYGYTIDNLMNKPMRGKDLPALKGKGFRVEDNKYYATVHGKVELTERGIIVTNLLDVRGDVDISYGHIDFDGDVSISGDVKSGMTIKAAGNLEIGGHIGNCRIEAGGNIVMRNGMQGKFSGILIAGGDITCKFFENSRAKAGGNIIVRSVIHSTLEAEGKVIVEGKRAMVLGGSIHAVQGLELNQAGNEKELFTVLSAGVSPKVIQRNAELARLISKIKDEIDLLNRSAKVIERMPKEQITKEIESQRMKVVQAKVIKTTELRKYENEVARNEAIIASGAGATISVENVIYPGCRIELGGRELQVKQELKHVKFLFKNGDIEAALLY